MRLVRRLCDLVPGEPEAFGGLAIMAFGAARANTRVYDEGLPILLAAQDRSRWKSGVLREGLMALRRARSLGGRGPYVLQAEIAAAHVTAPRWESTDWATIVAAHDALAEVSLSPVGALNRAVAVSMLAGPSAGLAALNALERPLADYHLFYAARADMLERTGGDPRPDLERAISLAANEGDKQSVIPNVSWVWRSYPVWMQAAGGCSSTPSPAGAARCEHILSSTTTAEGADVGPTSGKPFDRTGIRAYEPR